MYFVDPTPGALLVLAFQVAQLNARPDDTLFEPRSPPTRLAASSDGKILAALESSGNVVLWDIPDRQALREIGDARASDASLVFSPNNELLAAGSIKKIRLWDVSTGEEKWALDGHATKVLALDFSTDGKGLASISSDGTLIIWDVIGRKETFRTKLSSCQNPTVAYRPDGSVLIADATDVRIQVHEVRDGTLKQLVGDCPDNWPITCYSFSPDRSKLAVAVKCPWLLDQVDKDKLVKIHVLRRLPHANEIKEHSGSFRGSPIHWTTPLLCWRKPLLGHKAPVLDMAFTPDGTRLLTASGGWKKMEFKLPGHKTASLDVRENVIKVWDLAQMKELATFQGHKDPVCSLAISADSDTAYSASRDSSVRMWSIPASQAAKRRTDRR